MQIKILQFFISGGNAVPPGSILKMPSDLASQYIAAGLATSVQENPAIDIPENLHMVPAKATREKAIRTPRENAVTHA